MEIFTVSYAMNIVQGTVEKETAKCYMVKWYDDSGKASRVLKDLVDPKRFHMRDTTAYWTSRKKLIEDHESENRRLEAQYKKAADKWGDLLDRILQGADSA